MEHKFLIFDILFIFLINGSCKKFSDRELKSGKANGFEVHIWSNGNKYDEWQKDREKVAH